MKDKKTLSLQERSRHNPMGWFILFSIVLIGLLWYTVPKTVEWMDKFNFIRENKAVVESLIRSNDELREELVQLETQLEEKREENELSELQRFPEDIDINKTVRVLELYALQLKNLNERFYIPYFELQSVQFGRTQDNLTQDETALPYKTTDMSLEFETDSTNFKDFVLFLQNGRVSPRFKEGFENDQIDPDAYQYLSDNLLPILHIDSIQYELLDEDTDDEEEATPFAQNVEQRRLRVTMDVQLFSQSQSDQ